MRGIPASEGIAIGPVLLWGQDEVIIEKKTIDSVEAELEKFEAAVDHSKNQLEEIRLKALETMGEEEAQVFDAHILLMEDPEWIGKIKSQIESDLICSEYIVQSVTDAFVAIFEAMDNEYLAARAADLKDVAMRLIRNILGVSSGIEDIGSSPVIIVAEDLTPSDTAQLSKDTVLGFITEQGNKTSHSAIIARTMGIPALVGAEGLRGRIHEAMETKDTLTLAFDGSTGEIFISPKADVVLQFEEKKKRIEAEHEADEAVRGKESITLDGKRVEIACNIAKPDEADYVVEHDGEGVGLFRSEFLFMERSEAPSEEEQFEAYKRAVIKLKGRPLIVRTLDAGGDKHIPYLNVSEEMNPFLGYRAIRICLDDTVLFRTQLRAILRASDFGKIKVMFPMIAAVDEFLEAKALVLDEMKHLRASGVSFDENIELGIMVEIPSTAVLADLFANHVDFFSIGTNDLTQYTLAADRMNSKLKKLYNHRNPAVLRLIKMVIDAAHKKGKWVGMCGEAAGDTYMTPILIGLGLDEFSMAPSSVLKVRRLVRKLSQETCSTFAQDLLAMEDVVKIEEKIEAFIKAI